MKSNKWPRLCAAALALLVPGLCRLQAGVELSDTSNFSTGFEASEGYTGGYLQSDTLWQVGGSSDPLIGDFGFNGTQALELDVGAALSIDFSSATAPPVGWIDLYLKPAFSVAGDLPVDFALGQAALTGFVKVGGEGEIYVLHGDGAGNGQWMATGTSVPLSGNLAADWLRMTYRLDYATQRWDLFLNSQLQLIDLGFIDPNAPPLSAFRIIGSSEGATRFDQFEAGFSNPLFTDADNDGIADAYESAQGLDVSLNDRDFDNDFDSVPNVIEYISGLQAGDPDSDGDGVSDGDELAAGADPASADLYDLSAVPFFEDFESFAQASIAGLQRWAVNGGTARVQSLAAFDGVQALILESGQTLLELSNHFDGSEGARVWIDFQIQPTLFPMPDALPAGTIEADATAVFFFSPGGQITLLDGDGSGSGSWRLFSHAAAPSAWQRVTLLSDYSTQSYSLWINGVRVAQDMGFATQQPFFKRFMLKQGIPYASILDALRVDFQKPFGLDTDGDGLTDEVEDANGNGTVDPGESDLTLADTDGDGLPDGWEVQYGLDPLADDATLDLDGDGLANADEFANGLDPLLQDVNGADGFVRRDVWTEIAGNSLSDLVNNANYPLAPSQQLLAVDLDFPQSENFVYHYGQRIYGLIVAPETAAYTFWIAGDDDCEFWLSSDESSFNRKLVVQHYGWTNYRQWRGQSTKIQLEAGQVYFFELLHKEGVGADHVSMAWQYGAQTRSIITGEHLRVNTPEVNDLDQDGLPDDWETANGLDPEAGYGVNGYAGDFDGDGLLNHQEYQHGTNPILGDSDGDGFSDLVELGELFTDPTVQDLDSEPVVVTTVNGADFTSARGSWGTQGTELYSVDSTGSVSYALNFAEAGAYRLVVEVTEQNPYKSDSSTFELRASLDAHSYGIQSAAVTYGDSAELHYYLPYLTSGSRDLELDWLNGFGNAFLRIRSVRLERIDGVDADLNGISDWIEDRASQLGSEALVPLAIYAAPFCFEGTSFAPVSVVIDSHPLSDASNLRAETVQQALYNSYFADIELTADEDRQVRIHDQSGLRSRQYTLTWAAFNAHVHDFIHIRLDDSLLLTASDPALPVARPIELELIAPNGVVESHSLPALGRLQARFDQAGDWLLAATLLPLSNEEPIVYHSVIRVSSASLAPSPIVFEDSVRSWTPSISDVEVLVESDAGLPLYEPAPGSMPRNFELNGSLSGGRLIARLPQGGAILSTTDTKVIRDYSRTETNNQVVEMFSDGTVMVSAYIILNEVPEGFSLDINVFKSGVTFDDGTIWRTISAEDFDDQGRYRFFMLRSPGVNGGNCHRYWYQQDGHVIGTS